MEKVYDYHKPDSDRNWYEIIGDKTIADAICDHLVTNSHKIELKGILCEEKNWNNLELSYL